MIFVDPHEGVEWFFDEQAAVADHCWPLAAVAAGRLAVGPEQYAGQFQVSDDKPGSIGFWTYPLADLPNQPNAQSIPRGCVARLRT